jgi:AraC-like DNA-binding protein
MVMKYFLPNPALREYVRLLQIVHLTFDQNVVVPPKAYWPRPEQCLAFNPRQPEMTTYMANGKHITRSPVMLIGQPSLVTTRNVPHDFLLFQVVFQPGALFRLLGIPSHELTDIHVDAETVFSKEIGMVNERLRNTNNYVEMTEIVENFIHYLIKRRKCSLSKTNLLPIDKVAHMMVNANPARYPQQGISLDKLAREACLSPKQFYNNFVERMGISPKTYARIVRFDNAMKSQNAQPHKDWLSIALECGYYDYQHMVKDFKDFTKTTPTEFIQKENLAPERVFGLKEDF